jgi:hypothetical protein
MINIIVDIGILIAVCISIALQVYTSIAIRQSKRREDKILADLDNLSAQVEKNTTVEESAVTLISGLAAQIAALKNDPVALQGLVDRLNSSATDLANAVAANTPAA